MQHCHSHCLQLSLLLDLKKRVSYFYRCTTCVIEDLSSDIYFPDDNYARLYKRYKEVKHRMETAEKKVLTLTVNEEELVPLFPGCPLNIHPTKLAEMTASSVKESIQLRSLLKYFFTDEELATCSRTGRVCGANKAPKKPELDPTRQYAIYG